MISVIKDNLFKAETLEGRRTRVGLRDLLVHAHEYSNLCGRTVTGRVALIRLCIAFLEDVYRLQYMDERRDLLEEGCFDERKIDMYIEKCEEDGPCFLLDDVNCPFMQAAYCEEADANAEKPVAALFFDEPAGNSHIFFEHRPIETIVADASEALEGMLETYMFCTAGAQQYPSALNNTNPVYCIIHGRTLFETLVLNMVSEEELPNNIPFGAGMVPWRMKREIKPKEVVTGISFLEAMTWQPRRITLTFDDDQTVRSVFLQQGKNFTGDGRWRDPWVPFRRKKDGSETTVKPELGRGLWRDAGSILSTLGNNALSPVPIINVSQIWEDIPYDIVPIEAVGMITNQAAILGVAHEMLRIPEALLLDEEKSVRFTKWIDITEEIYNVSRRIIAGEYSQEVARLVGESLLQDMHDAMFGRLQNQLIDAWDVDTYNAADQAFGSALFDALRGNLRRILEHTGVSVDNIKKQNAAEAKAMGYCVKRLKEGNVYE